MTVARQSIEHDKLLAKLEPSLGRLAARGILRSYRKNTIVLNEGEAGDSLFVVIKTIECRDGEVAVGEVDMFVGQNYILSSRDAESQQGFLGVRARARHHPGNEKQTQEEAEEFHRCAFSTDPVSRGQASCQPPAGSGNRPEKPRFTSSGTAPIVPRP